jgi:hypothetical protein
MSELVGERRFVFLPRLQVNFFLHRDGCFRIGNPSSEYGFAQGPSSSVSQPCDVFCFPLFESLSRRLSLAPGSIQLKDEIDSMS